jgi:hypothetical protein
MTLLPFCTKVTLLTTPAPARLVVDVLRYLMNCSLFEGIMGSLLVI